MVNVSINSRGKTGVFVAMVGAVMALLKFKEDSEYKQVDGDEEEGRVALTSPPAYRDAVSPNDEAGMALLNTELPTTNTRRTRKKGCCVCFGINCSLFCKALGIVTLLFTLYGAARLLWWAFTPGPTGLENLPVFSTALGCLDTPHLYNDTQISFTSPVGSLHDDHAFDIRGDAVGTFTLAQAPDGAKEIKYDMTISSNDAALLKNIHFREPHGTDSRFIVTTPRPAVGSKSCTRFDITMYVPSNLKKLHVASHSPMHFQVAKEAHVHLDDLYVTLFAMEPKNMIVSHEKLHANNMALEVYRGWIVGEASIVKETSIITQRGDGIANLRIHPTTPSNPESPEPATLRTTTGAGRTDISYVGSKGYKRLIDSIHISSRNADLHLTYKEAEFNGKIELSSKSYTLTGASKLQSDPNAGGDEEDSKWTHYAGDVNGGDKIYVSSRGWTGLYF
ncbi:hypothetical protein BDQ12DRAFT_701788 [Crucibulum laeve]|uniref:Uncharacterized protein n=1 Tax=Crucibulum laeve TaxID=68775 RepID=A0A5C3MIT1_9AGAR|nr:hypothetical protein BDQ12DRAFT_701788 [Crucibulum laeve]